MAERCTEPGSNGSQTSPDFSKQPWPNQAETFALERDLDLYMNKQPVKLVFLASRKFESNAAVRGAFLLTDAETKPLEFRCTNPVRPTQLQRMLYGDILEQHILVELIGQPLIRTIKDQPDLILINERSFLELRSRVIMPVVQIANEGQLHVSSDNDQSSFQVLNCLSSKFDPVVIKTHPSFPDDKIRAREILAEIFNNYDLLEPFTRVSTALEQVHVQKIGEM